MDFIFHGYMMGVLVSLPLGPMAILIIQRTANRDLKSGLYTALGVVMADAIWAVVAGFSVLYILSFLREYQSILQIIAGLVILLFGVYIFQSHPLAALKKFKRKGTRPIQCFGSSFLITLGNPSLALAYIAILASIKISFTIDDLGTFFTFIPGFILGAMSWWLVVTIAINLLRHHFNLRILWWFNKISGAAIILFVIISSIVVLFRGNPNI